MTINSWEMSPDRKFVLMGAIGSFNTQGLPFIPQEAK